MINEEITAIKDILLNSVKPKKIYLFGSYAKNTYNEESDYNFYLVVPDDAGDKIELSQKAYKALRGIRKRPVNIVVGYESSFEARRNEETLEESVISEGVLLYVELEIVKVWMQFAEMDFKRLPICLKHASLVVRNYMHKIFFF